MADFRMKITTNFKSKLKEKVAHFSSRTSSLAHAGMDATSAAISVNRLSLLSDRMSNVGSGETLKKASVLISAILIAFFMSDLIALLIDKSLPLPPVSRLALRSNQMMNAGSPMDYEIIISRNLFSSQELKVQQDEIDLDAEPVPTQLPWDLTGTVIFQNPSRSMAAIRDKNENKLYPIRAGDFIEEIAEILSIEPTRVVFINKTAKRKEMVELPEDQKNQIKVSSPTRSGSAGIREVQEHKYMITRDEVNTQMANLNTLMTQALATPEMVGGQMIGFRLKQIQGGSFYQKIGLKENDIITSVNGEKITDAAKALSLLQDLKTMNSLDLGIKRNGKDTLLNYDIQ